MALALANSPWRDGWAQLWHQELAIRLGSFELALSLSHWVNDALMDPWVAFVVMPVFALANAGVPLDAATLGAAEGRGVALAVTAGLLLGKPLGIALFALAAVRLGLAALPAGVGPGALFGVGLLGGIGFTMALFLTALAFGEGPLTGAAKVGVLSASLLACVGGLLLLARVLPRAPENDSRERAARRRSGHE